MLGEWRRWAWAVAALIGLSGCTSEVPTSPPGADVMARLVGPTWTLTRISGQPVLAGTNVTATFSSENRVGGSAGCNSYFGSLAFESGRVKIGPLGSTLMACSPDAVMTQESRYLALLEAATSLMIAGDELRLGPSASETTLVFSSR